MKKQLIHLLLCVFTFSITPSLQSQNDFEIAKNVDIFISILKELNAKYADEISPGDLTKTAIDAMLSSLDPYTVYYPESQIEDFRLMTTGQYGGIGALIQEHGNYIVISEPYEGAPAAEAGLLAGDRILKVNNRSTAGRSSADVSTILKGEPGSTLTIEIERPTTGKKEVFNITRKDIKFPNIPYFGMLDDQIGYIKLDQFTEKAGNEVKEAFLELKEKRMKALILDLRNNGGGLMTEAINIMNIFVDQNIMITETKGKITEQTNVFKTRNPVTDKNIPVVVLVNEYSASSSEIVAGAFQDLDRGVVIGKKTFGKGLVQNIIPLTYNTTLKITVSKYYIPSGRCVQNIDYFSADTLDFAPTIPDSLATPFKTKNGRIVYDKGGIEPDIMTKDSIPSNILVSLMMHNLIFDYANQYYAKHPTLAPANEFVIDDALYQDFLNFLKDKKYDYNTESEHILEGLKNVAIQEQHFEVIETLYQQMKESLKEDKKQDIHKFKEEISLVLANEIVARYYYQKGRIINSLSTDPDIKKAKELLKNPAKYKSILSGKKLETGYR